jgi:hypothetical protein
MIYVCFPKGISKSTDKLLNVVAFAPEPGQAISLPCFILKINLSIVLSSVPNVLSLQPSGPTFCKNFLKYSLLYEINYKSQNTS